MNSLYHMGFCTSIEGQGFSRLESVLIHVPVGQQGRRLSNAFDTSNRVRAEW